MISIPVVLSCLGVHLILIGGLCQLVAGLLAYRKYDHLGGTAFVGYAALWMSYGATRIFQGGVTPISANTTNGSEFTSVEFNVSEMAFMLENSTVTPNISELFVPKSAVAGLLPYILLSFILAFCSATVNYIMPFVFGAITATLVFEAVGAVAGNWALVVSGVLELLILVFAIYGSAALLVKGLAQRYVLKGFGNPLFNVLLLGTANSSSAQSLGQEKKKNTKYAEPMALGYFCDTVSPFIFAFYSFHYFPTFAVGAVWISINSASQLLSSFYAYLRQDTYHATKFGLHCTFWLVKAWEEFVVSIMISQEDAASGRLAMVGDWFFVAAAIILCVVCLSMDTMELLHNLLFLLLTLSTVSQIPLDGYYYFFGVACSLFTAMSLYGTFARLVNSIAEKSLIRVGPQPVSATRLQAVLGGLGRCRDALAKKTEPAEGTRCQLPDALFYLTNGIAALSAIHERDASPAFLHMTVVWVLIPGAIMQAYVSRLQVQRGKRFGSVIPFFYAAIWATWAWYRFAGEASLIWHPNVSHWVNVLVMF